MGNVHALKQSIMKQDDLEEEHYSFKENATMVKIQQIKQYQNKYVLYGMPIKLKTYGLIFRLHYESEQALHKLQ